MRLLKNSISMAFPSVVFLCSTANEDDTEGNIEVMGRKLAEVRHLNYFFTVKQMEVVLGFFPR